MRSVKTILRHLSFVPGAAAALSIGGCGPSPDANRVCTDNYGKRVSDDDCRRSGGRGGGAYWHYGGRGKETAYGEVVTGGSRVAHRGGFGSSARGSGGG